MVYYMSPGSPFFLRIRLENGAGIAGLPIATECLVTEAPEKMEKAGAPALPEGY